MGEDHPVAEFPRTGYGCLVVSVSVNFALLHSAGKAYPWKPLERCPSCHGMRPWGHGYVARYFDGQPERLWMKRWRCPDCAAVHTARPSSHWSRFLAPWWLILTSVTQKLLHGRWLSMERRQRQQYWMRGYRKQQQIAGGLATVEQLYEAGLIVVTHSPTERYAACPPGIPHLSFAATGGIEGG